MGNEGKSFKNAVSSASVWADSVEWSSDLHFVNIPFRNCADILFSLEKPCGLNSNDDRCLVSAIANFTERAGNNLLAVSDRTEAIKFLLHLVADAHQPLHAGFFEDRGGTWIHIVDPIEASLHEVWDSILVENMKEFEDSKWFEVANSFANNLLNRERDSLGLRSIDSSNMTQTAIDIVSETVREHTCASAYMNEHLQWIRSGDSLSEPYISSRTVIASQLLMKASVRLALILDAIAARFFNAEAGEESSYEDVGGTRNRFAFFEENQLTEIEGNDEGEEDELEEGTFRPTVPVRIFRREKVAQTSTTLTPMSPEEKKRIANRKKRERVKLNSRKVCGVDVASVRIIRKKDFFLLTYKQFVEKDPFYFPPAIMEEKLQYMSVSGRCLVLHLDPEVFGYENQSVPDELINAIGKSLGALEGTLQRTTTVDRQCGNKDQLFQATYDLLAARLGPGTPFPKIDVESVDLWTQDHVKASTMSGMEIVEAQLNELVVIEIGKHIVISLVRYLTNKKNSRWLFRWSRLRRASNMAGIPTEVFMDIRVLDFPADNDTMMRILDHQESSLNRKLINLVAKTGSRILDRLSLYFNGNAIGKWEVVNTGQIYAAFAANRQVGPRIREYVVRPPEEERKILKDFGLPKIEKFIPPIPPSFIG
jgi:hypothetical protein